MGGLPFLGTQEPTVTCYEIVGKVSIHILAYWKMRKTDLSNAYGFLENEILKNGNPDTGTH